MSALFDAAGLRFSRNGLWNADEAGALTLDSSAFCCVRHRDLPITNHPQYLPYPEENSEGRSGCSGWVRADLVETGERSTRSMLLRPPSAPVPPTPSVVCSRERTCVGSGSEPTGTNRGAATTSACPIGPSREQSISIGTGSCWDRSPGRIGSSREREYLGSRRQGRSARPDCYSATGLGRCITVSSAG